MTTLFLTIAIAMNVILAAIIFSNKSKISQKIADEERFDKRRKRLRTEEMERYSIFQLTYPQKTYDAFVKAIGEIDKIMEEKVPDYLYWNFKNDFANPNYVLYDSAKIIYRVGDEIKDDKICFKDMKVVSIPGIGYQKETNPQQTAPEPQKKAEPKKTEPKKPESQKPESQKPEPKKQEPKTPEPTIPEHEVWFKKNYAYIEKVTKSFTSQGIIPISMLPHDQNVIDMIVDQIYLSMPIDSVEFGKDGEIVLVPQM